MQKISLAITSSVIFLSSCASFKNLEYESIRSLDELSGIYIDTIGHLQLDNHVNYGVDHIMERDTADIYEFQFVDNKYLKVSTLTERGFETTKTYKGKYNKKENYLEISIKKKILPLILFTSYLNEKKRIGKNINSDLLIDYRHESFGMIIPLGASNYDYQTSSTFVKLENIEYIPTKFETKFGYTNLLGDTLINPKYDFARVFRNDVARVKVNDKWGLIDKKGNYIFEPQFDYISNIYKDSTAYVVNDNYMGLIDKKGNEILSVKELEIDDFYKVLEPSLYKIYKKQKEGIYNSTTKEYVIDPIYDNIRVESSSRYNELKDHNVERYFILSLNGEKSIIVNDTIVLPLTPKVSIDNIYSSYSQSDYFSLEKIANEVYRLNIDFSDTSISLKDIYPFYLKIKGKFYIIDHKNNYYELLREKETLKAAFSGKKPHAYIENNPLTHEEITNLFR